jgi:hypothetical protein
MDWRRNASKSSAETQACIPVQRTGFAYATVGKTQAAYFKTITEGGLFGRV